MTEMEKKLKDTATKCESLETENKTKGAELAKALEDASEARSESRAAREEIRQAGQIAPGKPFLLHAKFGDRKYALLNRLWSSPDAFTDLPKSAPTPRNSSRLMRDMRQRSCSGHSSRCGSARRC